ncbi:MAG: hypothetical protein AB7O38_21035, partial [Pirellulaceae bacterium]
ARDLVLELRSRYKLPAFTHKQVFDFTQTSPGHLRSDALKTEDPTSLHREEAWQWLRYANATRYEGVAVLIGHFRSVDDPDLDKTLAKVKVLQPECLKGPGASRNDIWGALRETKRRVSVGAARARGPLGAAFVTRNPLLPAEFFAPNGVDDFVARLNSGVKYSLLDNPGKYTVRVATFRGTTTINQREIRNAESFKVSNKLEIAADKSHRLTLALREKGVEAYEFHDRNESIVTVGSFESEGEQQPDGAVLYAPDVLKVVQQYQAIQRTLPGQRGAAMEPRRFDGISLDVQPKPMAVPKRSVAADYARSRN